MMIHLKNSALGIVAMLLATNHAAAQNGGGSESPYFHKGRRDGDLFGKQLAD